MSASQALVYGVKGQSWFAYDSRSTGGARALVGPIGGQGALAVAASGQRVVWVEDDGPYNMRIVAGTVGSRRQVTLIGAMRHGIGDLVAAGSYVYWDDGAWLGRVGLDGSDLQPHFLRLPNQDTGDATDGVAVDAANNLYFGQCENNRLGHVSLATSNTNPQIRWFAASGCPQGVAVAGRYLYWVSSEGATIGRIDITTGAAVDDWVRTDNLPLGFAAVGGYLYWTWDPTNRGPMSWLARASLSNAKDVTTKYLSVDGEPIGAAT